MMGVVPRFPILRFRLFSLSDIAQSNQNHFLRILKSCIQIVCCGSRILKILQKGIVMQASTLRHCIPPIPNRFANVVSSSTHRQAVASLLP